MNSLHQTQDSALENRFENKAVLSRRLSKREGISANAFTFEKGNAPAEPFSWPFESFSQIVFVLSGSLSITLPDAGRQTAQSVGYANPSHFTRAFRDCFGLNSRDLIAR